ncbi:hypothetical protein [Pyruvatibacter sp.]
MKKLLDFSKIVLLGVILFLASLIVQFIFFSGLFEVFERDSVPASIRALLYLAALVFCVSSPLLSIYFFIPNARTAIISAIGISYFAGIPAIFAAVFLILFIT